MLIKINKQPIEVTYEEEESQGIPWFQLCISTTAFITILSLMDYICFIFFYHHPLPWIYSITKFILHLIGA